ncbi:hypothetical protein E4U43_008002 [Claviceps pusilla]|uniref:Uncharacterized protein n=1 Tax=Claviceps pusilla TaxID=123648 RepID=A0A9P7NC30_9HYPO|nr:hypothetical protein E4U43_008002 [Claviceps pusilla]
MTRTRRSGSLHEAAAAAPSDLAPPPYEAAMGGEDHNDNDDDNDTREQRPFVSYRDEKQTELPTRRRSSSSSSSRSRSRSRMTLICSSKNGGTASKPQTPSKKWSSTPTLVCSILPSIPPGQAVLRARCFASGPSQQLRVALATSTMLQVYDARRDALLWELHGNSSQLVQGDEEPLRFGEGFRPSPDGRLLCVVASRGGSRQQQQRRLLIVDADTGWVRLEYALSATDGNKPHCSEDNSMVVVLGQAGADAGAAAHKGHGYLKVFSLREEEAEAHRANHVRRRIRFEKPAPGQAMAIRFAPDSKHLITCAGPAKTLNWDAAPPSISVGVYSVEREADRPIRRTRLPCSAKFFSNSNPKSSSNSSTSSSQPIVPFAADFHFPAPQEWLVSFPDYTGPAPGRTCLLNARLGQIVAILPPPELSLSQKWQVGVASSAPPAQPTELAHDQDTGLFTRMDVTGSLLSRRQTVTVTKFALSANGGREKAALRRALQIRVVVLPGKAGDVCALSSDGSHVLVRSVGGGEAKMEVFSVGV